MAFFIVLISFLTEYIDSALGMGYGTTMVPILILLGFSPLEIIPVILVSELITGTMAAFFHHREGNVNFTLHSKHTKIALFLGLCSLIGVAISIFVVLNIPKFYLKLYIGIVVFMMGVIIMVTMRKSYSFSWLKMSILGVVASFNKGISGGGYGPIVVGGQILSGVQSKNAIAITSLAEGITCAGALLGYLFFGKNMIDFSIMPYILLGSVISVPFATKSIKRISKDRLKIIIALLTIILGLVTIIKTII